MRIRLKHLDGLRGIAALAVVIHHIHQELEWSGELPARVLRATKFLELGHYAVAVFIVLSGYSLMLPVVRSTDWQLPGGTMEYLKRRARRILPPYYAALAFTLLLMACIPGLQEQIGGWRQNTALPAFTFEAVTSHVLLVHNLTSSVFKINSPMWSVATEWQIYFLMPWVLLPVWRRFGNLATVLAAVALGLAPHFVRGGIIDAAGPWYLGLFSFGMAAAVVSFSPAHEASRNRTPWSVVVVTFAAGLAAMVKLRPGLVWVNDHFAGLATAASLIYCARQLTQEESGGRAASKLLLLRFLEARWAVALGGFSYSLYLVHSPLVSLVHLLVHPWHLSNLAETSLVAGVSLPFVLLLAYVFHLAFERPFVAGYRSASRRDGAVPDKCPMPGRETTAVV